MDQVDLQKMARIDMLSVRVAVLERKIDFLLEKLDLYYIDSPPEPQFPEVEKWLRTGEKVKAIKAYQLDTGAGLSEAKAAVEKLQKTI